MARYPKQRTKTYCSEDATYTDKISLPACLQTCKANAWCKGFTMGITYISAQDGNVPNPANSQCQLYASCTQIEASSTDLFLDSSNYFLLVKNICFFIIYENDETKSICTILREIKKIEVFLCEQTKMFKMSIFFNF